MNYKLKPQKKVKEHKIWTLKTKEEHKKIINSPGSLQTIIFVN